MKSYLSKSVLTRHRKSDVQKQSLTTSMDQLILHLILLITKKSVLQSQVLFTYSILRYLGTRFIIRLISEITHMILR